MIIGIDAGGTATKGALINNEEEVLFTFESGYGNPLINEQKAFEHIETVMDACKKASEQPIQHIVIGMAGYQTMKHTITLPKSWRNNPKLDVISDVELAYEAGLPNQEGILTIAGTGTIHAGKKNQKLFIRGGWGHLLGDEGGGYTLGRSAVKRVLYALEMGLDHTPFCEKVMSYMEAYEVNEVKSWFYSQDKTSVAALAKFINQLAIKGDREACQLLQEGASELARQVEQLYGRMELDEGAVLVVAGNVLLGSERFFSAFSKKITCPFREVRHLKRPAYMGVCSLAEKKKSCSSNSSHSIFE
ncbi:BadF/BadG/BcrA/BcrD ATPase family protein [Halobacillus ihumii]|uniref:BadF/BadG/BcrA/BcrD ATPase family protein n=1 Tax=Halobacillus ihumii TaxID=2686092 RepID=UPI0013D80EDB|nr:BadF/BadG/BcrA/BcrD ATPase family protein [Halobacillus ihumii]